MPTTCPLTLRRHVLGITWCALAWAIMPGASGQDAPPSSPTSPIAEADDPTDTAGGAALRVRQQRVGQMMVMLRQKFRALAERLQQTEPERAERLIKTLHEAEKLLLEERMGETAGLLASSRFDLAASEQAAILADVKKLVELLLAEDDDSASEAARLAQWKEQLENLAKEQRNERREAGTAADPEAALADLDARIAALEPILAAQKAHLDETSRAVRSPLTPLGPLAESQSAIRAKAEALAAPGADAPRSDAPGSDPSGVGAPGRPAGDTPSESSPPDGSPSRDATPGTPADSDPAESGPADRVPATDPSEPPGGSASTPASDNGPSPSQGKPASRPGDASLQAAVEHQKAAESELETGRGLRAERSEERAVAELEKALAEMKAERVRIARLPPETVPQLAKRQKRLADRAADLAAEMDAASKADSSGAPGSAGSAGGGKPTPGQKSLQQAGAHMDQAADDLGGERAESALRQEDEAIRRIEEAIREIDKRLEQLRKETREERLARLEARFRAMLDRQQVVTTETRAVAEAGELTRRERLALSKLAAEERALAVEAAAAYDILVEDGTSLVFPQIVATLQSDLDRVAGRLTERQVDDETQSRQADIETTLTELIDALKQLQKEGQGGGGGGGGGGQPSLLPGSAELKLLKSLQLRVNRRTEQIHRRVAGPGATLTERDMAELSNLSTTQQEITTMTEGVIRNLPIPPPE